MLVDPLDYQLTAVKKALSDDNLRPRLCASTRKDLMHAPVTSGKSDPVHK